MDNGAKVLVVEDDADLRGLLLHRLESAGYRVSGASDGDAAVGAAREMAPDVALVDMMMPGISGMDLIQSLREVSSGTQIVILTGHPSLDTAISALREGVFDYLRKPDDIGRVADIVRKALDGASRRRGAQGLPSSASGPQHKAKHVEPLLGETSGRVLVGSSPEMQKVGRLIREVAQSDMTVLLRGETGTGKDVVAHLLHDLSGRGSTGEFCKVNCPSVQENLLESEMFGYEKGAFTGADRQRPGRFEMASSGTVFLDEVGAITPVVQAKLLEAIEYKSFFRVGGSEKLRVDVRIVAATNAPLEKEVKRGTFRSDLFYRLQHYSIVLPPLRDRVEDIVPLVDYFLEKYAARYGKGRPPLPPEIMARLLRYEWPGNVRELESMISRYMLTGDPCAIEEALEASSSPAVSERGRSVLQEREVQTLNAALSQTGWNQRKAAKLLGVSYSALRRRIAKYAIAKPGKY
jgi:two-component system, NtrC family, response regulator AtoC